MKRLHLHVVVKRLPDAIRLYSDLFDTPPCCGRKSCADWRVDEPPVKLAVCVAHRPTGLAHFGLAMESATELAAFDHVVRGPMRTSGTVPWEVSVENQPAQKESRS